MGKLSPFSSKLNKPQKRKCNLNDNGFKRCTICIIIISQVEVRVRGIYNEQLLLKTQDAFSSYKWVMQVLPQRGKKGVDTESKAGKDEKGALQRDGGGGGVASVLMLMSD